MPKGINIIILTNIARFHPYIFFEIIKVPIKTKKNTINNKLILITILLLYVCGRIKKYHVDLYVSAIRRKADDKSSYLPTLVKPLYALDNSIFITRRTIFSARSYNNNPPLNK